MSGSRVVLGLAAAVAVMAAPLPAFADKGAGMVLKLSGPTEPPLSPFTELPAGQAYKLDAGTTISIVHYGSCQVVTIVGGQVTLTPDGVDSKGGVIKDSQVRACPKDHLMTQGAAAATAGGMLMRGTDTLQLSTRPAVIFAGDQAGDIAAAEFMRGDRVIAKVEPSGHGIAWPASQAPLAMGADYTMRIIPKSGEPLDKDFSTVPDGDVVGGAPILVVQ